MATKRKAAASEVKAETSGGTQFVTYHGPSDYRVLTKANLNNDEADFSKTTFAQNVPHEVSSSAAEILLDTFGYEFREATQEELDQLPELKAEAEDEDVADGDEQIVSQSTSEGSGTGSTTGTTSSTTGGTTGSTTAGSTAESTAG